MTEREKEELASQSDSQVPKLGNFPTIICVVLFIVDMPDAHW